MTRRFRPLFAALAGTAAIALTAGCGMQLPGLENGMAGAFDASGTKGGARGANDWTVFVYMGADNNLSPFAGSDLNEMEAGLKSERVKFVVLMDQEGKSNSRIYEVKPDSGVNEKIVSTVVDDKGAVIPSSKEVDTGNPKTLENFLRWGTKAYPARRSALVIWNHGGGAFYDAKHLKSFCTDDTSNSHLNLVDLWRPLQTLRTSTRFDIVGFDTCLLGHAETAYQLRNTADFLVSSEKTEPGDGWNYEALSKALSAKPTMMPREFSTVITKSFQSWYKKSGDDATLSSIDLAKFGDKTVPAINKLADGLTGSLSTPAGRGEVARVLRQAVQLSAPRSGGEEYAIDAGLLFSLVKGSSLDAAVKAAANTASIEYGRAIVDNVTVNVPTTSYTGLKLYFSVASFNQFYAVPQNQSFGTSKWAQFVEAFHKAAKR